MAKYKVRKGSHKRSNMMYIVVLMIFIAGFAVGFFVARDRYIKRITQISKLHMEKADLINALETQMQVLGASTKTER